MPTPPGQPQGFAAGGIVKLATAGQVPVAEMIKQVQSSSGRRSAPTHYMEGYWERNFPTLMASKEFLTSPLYEYPEVYLRGAMQGDPDRPQTASGAFEPITSKLKAQDAARLAEASVLPASPAPDYLRRAGAPIRSGVLPESSVSAPMSANSDPLPAPAGGAGGTGGYAVTDGGIAAFDPNQAIAGSAPAAGMPNPYNVSAPELKLQEYLENDENFKLPEALSYQGFIDEAVGEEQAIRAEAKKQALGAALVQLGAGLAAGDMAKGLTTAGAESRDILSEGRREASAQKALAQQFKLKGMEGERDVKLKQMDMDLKRTEGLATLVGGNRRAAEERAMQIARMQQDASQHAASIGIQSQQLVISRERAELEKKQGAMQFMEDLIETAGIKAPTQARLDAWETANRLNPATAGPNPMDTYMAQRAAAAKLAAPKVERVYGIPAKDLYIDAVKPVSNPPQSGWGITKLPGK
jgi:hypothetical protein